MRLEDINSFIPKLLLILSPMRVSVKRGREVCSNFMVMNERHYFVTKLLNYGVGFKINIPNGGRVMLIENGLPCH